MLCIRRLIFGVYDAQRGVDDFHALNSEKSRVSFLFFDNNRGSYLILLKIFIKMLFRMSRA